MMPVELVLVRHGESEGNVAAARSKRGDHSSYSPEFSARHSSSWRLTDKGVWEAQTAGEWIRQNILGGVFQAHFVSDYVRAMETAGRLDLPGAMWKRLLHLRERDWGDLDVMSQEERRNRFAESLKRREAQSLLWCPPNGESIATLCETRLHRHHDTLHRQHANHAVIEVVHGEVMWAHRVTLERMSSERFAELDFSKDPRDRIHNCQILHYSRTNPVTHEVTDKYEWMRSACPTDLSKSYNEWMKIERPIFGNEDLLALVARTPRLIAS